MYAIEYVVYWYLAYWCIAHRYVIHDNILSICSLHSVVVIYQWLEIAAESVIVWISDCLQTTFFVYEFYSKYEILPCIFKIQICIFSFPCCYKRLCAVNDFSISTAAIFCEMPLVDRFDRATTRLWKLKGYAGKREREMMCCEEYVYRIQRFL